MYDWGLVRDSQRQKRDRDGERQREAKRGTAPLYASTRTVAPASACAPSRGGMVMHARKCTCEPLGTRARTCAYL